MREVRIALAAGLGLLAIAIAVALARSPASVARSTVPANSEEDRLARVTDSATFCQGQETVPSGTSAIRLSLGSFVGPAVRVQVYSDGRQITSGERGSGWTGRVVAVPVVQLSHTVSGATICASLRLRDELVTVFGEASSRALAVRDDGRPQSGRIYVEDLRPGTRTWASLVPAILAHMGLGRASSGGGIVFIAFALLLAVGVLSARLVLRELT